MSPTVLREGGFRIAIPTLDHEPPHVHVFKDDWEVVVDLLIRGKGPGLRRASGVPQHEKRQALALVRKHQFQLLRAWKELHGTP